MQYLAQSLNIKTTTGQSIVVQGRLQNINNLSDVINLSLTFIIPFAGVALLLVIIYGGYEILMSQGVAEKLEGGKHKITSGIVGFVLLVLSYFIAKLLGYIFGVGEGIL